MEFGRVSFLEMSGFSRSSVGISSLLTEEFLDKEGEGEVGDIDGVGETESVLDTAWIG